MRISSAIYSTLHVYVFGLSYVYERGMRLPIEFLDLIYKCEAHARQMALSLSPTVAELV